MMFSIEVGSPNNNSQFSRVGQQTMLRTKISAVTVSAFSVVATAARFLRTAC